MGEGSPIIFVHCSSATHKEWLFAAQHYSSTHTCILPDLIGYGKSSGHLGDDGNPVHCTDADAIALLLDELDEPADVIGHSYGGVACIEAARLYPDKVKSLFLIEPVTFHLLRSGEHADVWKKLGKLAEKVTEADAAGDYPRATHHYMSYWIGSHKWIFSPNRFKQSVIRTVPKVAHEFRQVFHQDTDASVYQAIKCPVTLLTGGKSTNAAHRASVILDTHFPDSRIVEIAGAGHMMPITHPTQTFDLLCEHLSNASKDPIDPTFDATV